MSDDTKHVPGQVDYERRDIPISVVVYFLIGLAVAAIMVHFLIAGLYDYLDKRTAASQAPVSPMVKASKDTRKLSTNYQDYLKQNFPSPQLEIDERTQLNKIRLEEEQTLATYGYVDQKAGVVRIPIERAMDLIAQRGLPVRTQASNQSSATQPSKEEKKGTKQ